APEPVPEDHLPQRGLRPSADRAGAGARHAGAGGAGSAAGGPVGRGQRPPPDARHRPVGRPAATALHRTRPRQRARGAPARRAVLGTRPGRHPADQGAAGRAEAELLDRHRDAQHATGIAGVGFHGVLLPRPPDRIRADQATLHEARGRAYRGLHYRTVRMSASPTAAHRHFHDELSELKAKLLTMAAEVQAAPGRALAALLRRDGELAARVIAGDRAVDALELEIEETVIDLL